MEEETAKIILGELQKQTRLLDEIKDAIHSSQERQDYGNVLDKIEDKLESVQQLLEHIESSNSNIEQNTSS